MPLRFGDLTDDEADDGEEGAEEGREHEELEAVNDSFVVESSHLAHRGKNAALDADVVENFPHHVAEEEEVNSSGDGAEDDESHLLFRGEIK